MSYAEGYQYGRQKIGLSSVNSVPVGSRMSPRSNGNYRAAKKVRVVSSDYASASYRQPDSVRTGITPGMQMQRIDVRKARMPSMTAVYADGTQATQMYGGHIGGAVPVMQLQAHPASAVQISLPPTMATMVDQVMALEAQVKAAMEAHLSGVDGMVRQALVMATSAMATNANSSQTPSRMGPTSAPQQRLQPPQQQQLVKCARCGMQGDTSLFSSSQLNKLARFRRTEHGRGSTNRPDGECFCKRCTTAKTVTQRAERMQDVLVKLLGAMVPGEAGAAILKTMEMKPANNASQGPGANRKRSRGQQSAPAGNGRKPGAGNTTGDEKPVYRLGRLAGKVQEQVNALILFKKKHIASKSNGSAITATTATTTATTAAAVVAEKTTYPVPSTPA